MLVPKKSASWYSVLFHLRGTIYEDIQWRLFIVIGNSVLITVLYKLFGDEGPWLSMIPFTLIGLVLSIFLGFRNNTSYDRFWEGRKLWGGVVNTSRTLTRRILTLIEETDEDSRHTYVRFVAAYVHLLRQHLRDEWNPEEVKHLLSEEDIEFLEDELNRPIALLQRLGERLQVEYAKGSVHPMHLPTLEQGLTDFTNLQGGCERIKSTPIPFSYNVLLHRIVAIYCLMLPFGLVSLLGYETPIIVAFVGYAFLGIDALGDEIEEPFGHDDNDLPLNALTTMIEYNVLQRIPNEELPSLRTPNPITGVLN